MTTRKITFVLEQTLGNAVHAGNVAEAALRNPRITPQFVEIDFDHWSRRRKIPVLRNWTVEASWRARRGIRSQTVKAGLDTLYVQTHCAAQMIPDVMRRVPTVVWTDAPPVAFDTVGAAYGHERRAAWLERVKLAVTGSAFRRAERVIASSRWAGRAVVRDYGVAPEKVRVVYPGVRIDRFRPGERGRDGTTRLLFVGGDFQRKGGSDLLAAFTRLGPDFELDLVTSSAVSPLPPGVRLHRNLTHASPALYELYARADVFVLPTRADAFPLVLGEALAAGLPIVASDVGAVREIVVPHVTGLLVRSSSADELMSALRSLSEDPQARQRMGDTGRQLALAKHDAERNCREIIDVLLELADAARSERSRVKSSDCPAAS